MPPALARGGGGARGQWPGWMYRRWGGAARAAAVADLEEVVVVARVVVVVGVEVVATVEGLW